MKSVVLCLACCAVLLLASMASAGILAPGPYVSCVTDNSVVVSWITDSSTSTNKVDYGPTNSYGNTATAYQTVSATEDTGTYYVHSAQLTGLSADTTYRYRVVSDSFVDDNGGAGWPVTTFPAPGTQNFSFVVYGDNRYGYVNDPYPLWHEKVMRGIENENPRLILNAGDVVGRSNYFLEWSGDHPSSGDPMGEFFRVVGDSHKIMQSTWIVPCKGNHETMGDYPTLYEKIFENPYSGNGLGSNTEEGYFAFDYGNARIISLMHNGNDRLDYGDDQYNWLVSELEAAQAASKWIFVIVHQPPFVPDISSSSKWGDGYMYRLQEYLVPLFEQYGVDMVFSGHAHCYVRWVNPLHYKGRDATPPVIEEVSEGVRYMIQGNDTYDLHVLDNDGDGFVETYVYDDTGTIGDYYGNGTLKKYDLNVVANGGGWNVDPLPSYTVITVNGNTCTIETKGMYNASMTDNGSTVGTVYDSDTFTRSGAGGNEYFVSTSGSDSNPGTIDQPWRTINYAVTQVSAGDTINVRAGTYNESVYIDMVDGTADNYITLKSYDGTGSAVITGSLTFGACHYWKMIGFDVSGGTNAVHIEPSADLSNRSQYITLQDCYIHDPSGTGDSLKVNQADYITVEDCEITSNADQLIDFVWVTNSVVRRCYLHDYSDVAFYNKGGSQYNIVEDCVISDALDSLTMALRYGGQTDVEFQNPNTDNQSEYTVFRNNILRNTQRGAIGTYDCYYAYFYNNTVHNCGSPTYGVVIQHSDPPSLNGEWSREIFVYNNVFLDTDGDMPEVYRYENGNSSGWHTGNNNYYNAGNAIPSSGILDPNQEAGATFGNPNLANPTGSATTYSGWLDCYRITANSTALIDKGSSTAGDDPRPGVHDDIEGTPRPQGNGWDIGAFEYVGTAPSPPVADFSGNPTSGTAPLTVAFTDLSSNSPTSWSWDFGDSGSSTAQNPSHEYTSAGDYTVALTATNAAGSDTTTKPNYISVTVPAPVADFSGSPTSGAAPLTVNFTDQSTNSPTSWSWDFGDSGTSTAQNPTHDYTSAGDYTVGLTATNAGGSDTATKPNYISVTAISEAVVYPDDWSSWRNATLQSGSLSDLQTDDDSYMVFRCNTSDQTHAVAYKFHTGYTPADVTKITVEYQAHSSLSDSPIIYALFWTADGGETVIVNGELWGSTDHSFTWESTDVATYLGTDGSMTVEWCGCPQSSSNYDIAADVMRIRLQLVGPPSAPVADFSGSPTSGAAPLTVNFTDQSTNSPTSWSWDFGDGGTSTAQNPSHEYTSAGDYTVSLTAANAGGSDTATKTDYISVTPPAPVADFTGSPTSGTVPLTVNFTDQSTNSPTSWSWDFGDGGTSTVQNPSHEYTSAGDTKTNYISVTPPAPVADFVGSPTSGTAPLTVNFTDQSTNSPTSWSWDFGDGGTSTVQNPSHEYTSAGDGDPAAGGGLLRIADQRNGSVDGQLHRPVHEFTDLVVLGLR